MKFKLQSKWGIVYSYLFASYFAFYLRSTTFALCSYMFMEIFYPILYEFCFSLSFAFLIGLAGRENQRINVGKSLDIQLCSWRHAAKCCGMFAGWKSLTGRPTSLSKHIKRINEALRAWRTCKLRDLNNGWADKTSFAIYPTVSSAFSRLSLSFLFPSVRHVSSWFSTARPSPVSKRTTNVRHCETCITNARPNPVRVRCLRSQPKFSSL